MTRTGRPGPGMVAAMVAASLLVGCGPQGARPARLGDLAVPQGAIARAEAAVAATPRDATVRLALARSYMMSGRFMSAGKTYQDVLTLTPADTAATIGLALMELAVGRDDTARTRLASLRDAPAADVGLARALAGDVEGAVTILADAARGDGANARIRQNLALALALAGRWQEARAVASQDLPPEMVDRRLGEWAMLGGTRDVTARVAVMLGTRPMPDAGQPPALALVDEPMALAAGEPAILPAAPPRLPLAAAPGAEPIRVASALVARPAGAAPSLRRPDARAVPPPLTATSGNYVVQFGAFATVGGAERAWRMLEPRLGGLSPLLTARRSDGTRGLVRLSVGGFTTRAAAWTMCRTAKADCFVRAPAGDSIAIWSSGRDVPQLAAR